MPKRKDLKMAERLSAIKNASEREEVAFRLKVIEFPNKYEISAAVSAFEVSKATIYLWKKKFRKSGGKKRVDLSLRMDIVIYQAGKHVILWRSLGRG